MSVVPSAVDSPGAGDKDERTAATMMEDAGEAEEGDNILDDILNTVDEKFDHEEDRRGEDEDDDDENENDKHYEGTDERDGPDSDQGGEGEEEEEGGRDESRTTGGGGLDGCPEGSDISDDEEDMETRGREADNSATAANNSSGKPLVDSDLSEVSKKSSESDSSEGEEQEGEERRPEEANSFSMKARNFI